MSERLVIRPAHVVRIMYCLQLDTPTISTGPCLLTVAGPYAAWMPRKSLHGWIHGVSRDGGQARALQKSRRSAALQLIHPQCSSLIGARRKATNTSTKASFRRDQMLKKNGGSTARRPYRAAPSTDRVTRRDFIHGWRHGGLPPTVPKQCVHCRRRPGRVRMRSARLAGPTWRWAPVVLLSAG
ncbi:hypothetical protein XarjCFBP7653_09490 [Xanthomonas arboricola]|nr:hypothetical protein XarjCFBP7653_09490 [Xanthomonas arboricola]